MTRTDMKHAPEQVCVVRDTASGLDGVIVLHSTALGPAAGGCRMWRYANRETMIADGCRLAEGMTYKNALAGLPLGGGKAVIRLPNEKVDRRALLAAFGRAVRDLDGSYVTAEDVGTSVEDMTVIAGETNHVAGLPPRGSGVGGDPSPWTARGVFQAMEFAARRRLARPLAHCTVAVQGVGHVGASLVALLHKAGAKVVVADVDSDTAARVAVKYGAELAPAASILSHPADILAPCALGGGLNHQTISGVAAKVICGAANNQLGEPEDAARLADRGILYAPDFVVNAGGIIAIAAEYLGWSNAEVRDRVDGTADRLAQVLSFAEERRVTTAGAAEMLARELVADPTYGRLAA